MGISEIVFYFAGALAIASALAVILSPHPVYSALALIVALFQIAVLFLLLDAQMVAFLQILVYAGAVMVLFLFVIMLLNLQRDPDPVPPAWRSVVLVAGGMLAAELAWFFLKRPLPEGPPAGEAIASDYGSVAALGKTLFTTQAFAFELTSVLLLVAVVGAVVLARREGGAR